MKQVKDIELDVIKFEAFVYLYVISPHFSKRPEHNFNVFLKTKHILNILAFFSFNEFYIIRTLRDK